MFNYLFEWLRNISYYLILVTAATYVLPSNSYRKYIRFFTGLVLIVMLLVPVFELFGNKEMAAGKLMEKYNMETQMKTRRKYDEKINIEENRESKIRIEMEEIVIGP